MKVQENSMNVGKSFYEVYKALLPIEEHPKFAKHTISAMVLWVFEELESNDEEVTPQSIEKIMKREFSSFADREKKKKVS